MNQAVVKDIKGFLQELGYPFDSISALLDSGIITHYFNSKWIKSSHSFAILNQKATDKQLLACSDVSNFYQFVPPYFAALSSKNGLQAIKRLSSYEQLIGPIEIGTFKEEGNLRIHISYLDNSRKNSRFSLLVDQISLISLIRTGTGKLIKPLSIGSKFNYSTEITEYLGISAQNCRDNYLVFSKNDLLTPFLTQNDIMWNFMEPGLKKYINDLKVDPPFKAIVQDTLFKLIAGGNFQLKDVANAIGISSRTVQRWLKNEGTNYKEQVNEVQKILALNLLQDTTLNTAEISFLVGFNNVTTFYKAFKRWTGKTVLKYRHQMIINKNSINVAI